jgi:hypothetical protein
MAQAEFIAKPEDFARLIQENPLAQAQLRVIVLAREKAELEAKLVEYTAAKENGHASQGEEEGVQEQTRTSQA